MFRGGVCLPRERAQGLVLVECLVVEGQQTITLNPFTQYSVTTSTWQGALRASLLNVAPIANWSVGRRRPTMAASSFSSRVVRRIARTPWSAMMLQWQFSGVRAG